ncbi:MAG: hypothetical protein WC867_00460 [Candidatus Pacearchaeota archaeon]|jgi:hypothetical protein
MALAIFRLDRFLYDFYIEFIGLSILSIFIYLFSKNKIFIVISILSFIISLILGYMRASNKKILESKLKDRALVDKNPKEYFYRGIFYIFASAIVSFIYLLELRGKGSFFEPSINLLISIIVIIINILAAYLILKDINRVKNLSNIKKSRTNQ